MDFEKAVSLVGTVTDLRRIASAHVIDHNQLRDEELRNALVKSKPQYAASETVKKAVDELLSREPKDSLRALNRVLLVDVLLDQYDCQLPFDETDAAVAAIMKTGMPVVCVDRSLSKEKTDLVEVDNYRGAFEAVTHLIDRGHKSIGLIEGRIQVSTSRERRRGYLDALAEAGIAARKDLMREGDFRQESGRFLAGQLSDMMKPPTARMAIERVSASKFEKSQKFRAAETKTDRKLRTPSTRMIWPRRKIALRAGEMWRLIIVGLSATGGGGSSNSIVT